MRCVASEAKLCETANRRGLRATRLYICKKSLDDEVIRFVVLSPLVPFSRGDGDIPALTLVSSFGRSISTGQASLHAPHSDEACARGTKSEPKNPAEMTEPMGPGYTLLYACPPISRNTGQAFRHAPHRMQ